MVLVDSYTPTVATNPLSANPQIGKSSQTSSIANTPADRKLRQAAGEFEGMLLSSLWKSMKSTFASPDDDDFTDPAHDSLDDMSIQAMSNAVGKAGGLGLGKLILKHLEPVLAKSQNQMSAHANKDSTLQADMP